MNEQPQNPLMTILLIVGLMFLLTSGPCQKSAPVPPMTPKATAITYVYEKDLHVVPRPVQAALSAVSLSPESVVGSVFEVDTVDGNGNVPTQYVEALAAAKQYGLPCLVLQAGKVVTKVVKNPTTEADVTEALK